jgi:MFS transporter, FSR family, fosmidomycin resistance protein
MTAIAESNQARAAATTVYAVLAAVAACHMINDTLQAILLAMYPLLRDTYALTFTQIGLLTMVFQVTASILQPLVGHYTDRNPLPYSLPLAPACTLLGIILLATASSFAGLLIAAAAIGVGSAIFHPESSRVARLASGGRYGMAQSLFQVGGNVGTAIGPLLVAWIILPRGQMSAVWFGAIALAAVVILSAVGRWYSAHLAERKAAASRPALRHGLSSTTVVISLAILIALMFSKFLYMTSLGSFYAFYLIDHFQVSVQQAQIYLFVFLGAVAAGTFAGGPIGDRIGRKAVIWFSILGSLPFTLLLPFANLFWTVVLTIPIGLILASAFSAIIVYGQELLPGRVGMVSGLFFGFAFGFGGFGAAALGALADATSITFVYQICAVLPAIGLLTVFLPSHDRLKSVT